MNLKIAWRNIWRNPRRSILTIAAICFATLLLVFMFSFQFGSYDAIVNSYLKLNTGQLQILAKGYNKNRDMHLVISKPERVEHLLKDMPNVQAFTSRGEAFALASSDTRTYGILITGINPEQEARVSSIKDLIHKGSYLTPDGDPQQAIFGAKLAKNLNVGIGDEVTLLGQGRDGSVAATILRVWGIFQSGVDEIDRSTAYMRLDTFQDVFFMRGAVHRIVVNARKLNQVTNIRQALISALKGRNHSAPLHTMTWEELVPGLPQSIMLDMISGAIWYFFLIIVVAFSIANTFLMAVFERSKEFGIMLALGIKIRRLVKILLFESLTITALGLGLGMLCGCLLTLYFQTVGIDITGMSEITSRFGISGKLYPRLSLLSATIGPAAVMVITFFAALYPALKVRKLNLVQALTTK